MKILALRPWHRLGVLSVLLTLPLVGRAQLRGLDVVAAASAGQQAFWLLLVMGTLFLLILKLLTPAHRFYSLLTALTGALTILGLSLIADVLLFLNGIRSSVWSILLYAILTLVVSRALRKRRLPQAARAVLIGGTALAVILGVSYFLT